MWRLEGERKAYESEEITTKAADWRKWIRCDDGIHVMSEIMVMTMGKVVIVVVVGGPNQRKDRQYDRAGRSAVVRELIASKIIFC